MRLLLINIVDEPLLVHPTVAPTLFIDDLSSEELDGEDDVILDNLGGFAQLVVRRIHADGMEVSATKSLVSASHPGLGHALEDRLGPRTPSPVKVALSGSTAPRPDARRKVARNLG